jgi:hypothetical protein
MYPVHTIRPLARILAGLAASRKGLALPAINSRRRAITPRLLPHTVQLCIHCRHNPAGFWVSQNSHQAGGPSSARLSAGPCHLTAFGRVDEPGICVKAALRGGVTVEEIKEGPDSGHCLLRYICRGATHSWPHMGRSPRRVHSANRHRAAAGHAIRLRYAQGRGSVCNPGRA